MIASFLEAAEEVDLQVLNSRVLEETVDGSRENLLVLYEAGEGSIEVYETQKTLEELLHPFRDPPKYILGVDPSYQDSKSYLGVEEGDLDEITGCLYRKVWREKDAYMKILQDFEA
ncbi:MAG: hypothetical protein ABEK10_03490 [Candidatus Nanosalina sp.]